MNIIFKKLCIVDTNSKKAKIQEFKKGLNLVSSDSASGGNYSGKSTLLRSLYYTLGADVFFDSSRGWQTANKYYFVLDFFVDDKTYSIIRYGNYFALYDSHLRKLYSTHNRQELSSYYSTFFGVSAYLKNRSTLKYVQATPFALFALSFIDQTKYNDGNEFKSFRNQDEFKDYNEDLILFHLGINNSKFNEIKSQMNKLNDEISKNDEKLSIINQLLDKAKESFDENYIESIESLQFELDKYKKQFGGLLEEQDKIKQELYELNETRTKLLHYINSLKEAVKESKPEHVLDECQCPLCKNKISNYTEVFFKIAKQSDDYGLEIIDCESELKEIERKIELKTQKYKGLADEVNKLEEIVSKSNSKSTDAIKSIGYKKCIDSMIAEYETIAVENANKDEALKKYKSEIKEINKSKEDVNKKYYELFSDALRRDFISIIELPDDLKIGQKISCSDNYVLVVIWMNIINHLKKELNPTGVFFPIVIDNPTDRDFSNDNKNLVLKYAFDLVNYNSQVIVSKTSFGNETLPNDININIINLVNEQYNLLNENDFDEAYNYLVKLSYEQFEQ